MKDGHLEAKDLMIGDFVRHRKTEEIIRIFEIDADRDVINNEPDGYYSERNILIGDIEPIPLTPEMLKKNGFEYSEDNECYLDEEGYISINIPHDADGAEIIIADGVNYIHVIPPYKEYLYVHELQHTLCLGGLTELAENFKV